MTGWFDLPRHWKWVELQEVAADQPNAIVDGPFGSNLKLSDYVDVGVPVLQGKNITNDTFAWKGVRFISEKKANELSRSAVRPGDILVVKIGSIGYAAIVDALNGHDRAIIPANLAKITPSASLVDRRYLFRWLTTTAVKAHLLRSASQTAQPALSLGKLKGLPIPLPPLPEQRRIADMLDKADGIRRKRKEAVALTGDLLRSTFLEMFGDPVTNPKGWSKEPLKQFGSITTGNTPPRDRSEYYGDEIEWIKSDNINTPSHVVTRAAEGLSAEGRRVGRVVPAGSTLMTCIAGSPDCIGNVGLADRDVAFNQQINAITPAEDVDFRFLYSMLLLGKRLVRSASTNSMKGMVSKGRLEAVEFPAPPFEMQRTFGEMFDRLATLGAHLYVATELASLLFQSLLSRAFRGELAPAGDVSARPIEGLHVQGA